MTVITGGIDGSRSENRSCGSSFKSRPFIFKSAHQAGGIDGSLDNFPRLFSFSLIDTNAWRGFDHISGAV